MKTHLSTFAAPLIAIAMAGLPIASASAQQAAPAAESAALTLKARIPLAKVDGRMDHVGVDIAGQRLFATAFDNKTLEVIDVQAGRQVHTIANLNQPQQTYFDAPTNHLFVSSSGDGTVKVFDGSTFQLLQTTQFSSDADNMRFDERNKHLVVAYGGDLATTTCWPIGPFRDARTIPWLSMKTIIAFSSCAVPPGICSLWMPEAASRWRPCRSRRRRARTTCSMMRAKAGSMC